MVTTRIKDNHPATTVKVVFLMLGWILFILTPGWCQTQIEVWPGAKS